MTLRQSQAQALPLTRPWNFFSDYEVEQDATRKDELIQEICLELIIHTKLEEEIFYPALKGRIEEDMLNEAYVEHDGAKLLINEIAAGGPDEQFYDAKVKVLSEQIEHHVEEEETELFPEVVACGVIIACAVVIGQLTLTRHLPNAEHVIVHSRFGHDGFLIESDAMANALSPFLQFRCP